MSEFRWLAALLLSLTTALSWADAPLTVGVSLLPERYFVERIGGDQVKVEVLVPPGKSPASYEPTPRQMEAMAQGRLYFRIGVPFEKSWLPRLQQAVPAMKMADLRDGLKLRPVDMPDGQVLPAGKTAEPDPHVWLSPPMVMHMADRIRDELIALRPAARSAFEANHAQFVSDLKALDQDVRTRLATKTKRHFMVFHPSWGYFADAYGLVQIPIEAGWKEPGPQTLARLIDDAKARQIRVIFVQKQFSKNEAETVAQAIGGEVLAVDPLAPDYLDNLRRVAEVFARTLQ